ncbi:hypothetical protein J6590_086807 [Homalodisca vitripennis]|nr:hypothetical protein J6590_086807 [Homalodisca vitripennis]
MSVFKSLFYAYEAANIVLNNQRKNVNHRRVRILALLHEHFQPKFSDYCNCLSSTVFAVCIDHLQHPDLESDYEWTILYNLLFRYRESGEVKIPRKF